MFKRELAQAVIPIFKKKINENPCDWAEKNLSLKNTIEGKDGLKFPNFSDSPDFKQIGDDLQDPDVREIIIMTSAQRGKTFFMIICALWLLKEKGQVGMFVLSDLDKMNKVRERVKKILQANKDVLGWDDSRGATKGSTFVFDNGAQLHWGILSSPSTIAETPADFVIVDEYDEYIERHQKSSVSALRQAEKRMQSKRHGKLIVGSTPKVIKGRGGILDLYSGTKKHISELECPNCMEYIELRHEDLRVKEFDDVGYIKTKSLGFAICPSCTAELSDSEHYSMAKKPRFSIHQDSVSMSQVRKGYHSAVVNATTKNFSHIMYEYQKCLKGGPLELADYNNSVWANPQLIGTENKEKELNELPYSRKTAPDDVQFLLMGADLGNNRLHIKVIGFANKDRSYLVDWDERNYGGRQNISEVKNILQEKILDSDYKTVSGRSLKILYCAIDCNHYTPDVLRICTEMRNLIPVRGSGTLKDKWKKVDADPKNNWNFKNSDVKIFELGHNYQQDEFESRLTRSYEEGSCYCIPQDTWSNVKEHYNNMILIYSPDGVNKKWEQRGRSYPVDWRDCTIYAIALYNILALKNQLRNDLSDKKVNTRRGFGHILQK